MCGVLAKKADLHAKKGFNQKLEEKKKILNINKNIGYAFMFIYNPL